MSEVMRKPWDLLVIPDDFQLVTLDAPHFALALKLDSDPQVDLLHVVVPQSLKILTCKISEMT